MVLADSANTFLYNDSFSTASYEQDIDWDWNLPVKIIYSILFVIIGVTNVTGNTCTLIAFFIDEKLRVPKNYYICNLAFTDLIIGISSIPFYSVYTVMYYEWPFGKAWCKVWSVLDYFVCAESAFTIILISLDRLLMVRLGPAQYPSVMNKQNTLVMLLLSWICAFLLYSPLIIGYDIWRGYSIVEERDCDVEFANEFIVTMVTSCIEFCIPFVLICSFNTYIYWNIRQRVRKSKRTHATEAKVSDAMTLNRDRKAARNLALLVVTFMVCWSPYTISNIVQTVCPEGCVNIDMYEFFAWLLWINSSMNPFLYALSNPRIRQHYINFLCKSCERKNRVTPITAIHKVTPMGDGI